MGIAYRHGSLSTINLSNLVTPGDSSRAYFKSTDLNTTYSWKRRGIGDPYQVCWYNYPSGCPPGQFPPNATQTITIPRYALSYDQTVSARYLVPGTVEASTAYPAVGDTVVFQLVGGEPATGRIWKWRNNDTLTAAKGYDANFMSSPPGCGDQPTCKFVPPARGRMYVRATYAAPLGLAHSWSEIIWRGVTPTATVSCNSPVPRGGQLDCQLLTQPAGAPLSNVSWEFRSPEFVVPGPNGVTIWGGKVAWPGEVRATYVLNAKADSAMASFIVTPRGWSWGSAQWSFAQGSAPLVGANGQLWLEAATRLGWNCSLPDCLTGFIRPDLANGETGGYVLAQGSGPNQGLAYIGSASFYSSRGSRVNPDLESGSSQPWQSSDPAQAGCSGGNWYSINVCMGPHHPNLLIAGIYAHEGYGSNGSNGHQAFWEAEAAKPVHDPWSLIEDIVKLSPADVDSEVATRVTGAQAQLERATCLKGEPTGNLPAVPFWYWSVTFTDFQTKTAQEGGQHIC